MQTSSQPVRHAFVNRIPEHPAAELEPIAAGLDCSTAQLAIAWCLLNPNVSTVILGASKLRQLEENLGALEVLPKLTDDVTERIITALS